jgi:uncharacterized membrane protein
LALEEFTLQEKRKQRKLLKRRRMRREFVTTWIPLVLSIPLALMVLFDIGGIVRDVLGMLFVLFCPGHLLILALFPAYEDLDSIERISFSFGLSIIVALLLGLILPFLSWGIGFQPILLAVSYFVMIMTAVAVYRRSRLPYVNRFFIDLDIELPDWGAMSGKQRTLSLGLAAATILTIGSIAYMAARPETGEKFTEFYVLSPNGYPSPLAVGEKCEVKFGIVNHEYRTVTYNVEVRANGFWKNSAGPFEVKQGKQMEAPISFTISQPYDNIKMEFLLFKDGESEPYHTFDLPVKVQ